MDVVTARIPAPPAGSATAQVEVDPRQHQPGGTGPYTANYAAAKAYVASLGQALHYELKGSGVDVLTLTDFPGGGRETTSRCVGRAARGGSRDRRR
jgi:NAD(P)-dependent dehydrogenase (short-subunit alcohol dehydrogenase family)